MPGKATTEQIFRGLLRGVLRTKAGSASNQWAGRTTIAAGSASVTVSTTNVDSDSLIRYGFQSPDGTDVASGGWRGIEVKSINPGAAVVFGWADGIVVARDTIIMWEIVRTQ